MAIPQVKLLTQEMIRVSQREFDIIQKVIGDFLPKFCSVFKISISSAQTLLNELFNDKTVLNYCTIRFVPPLNQEFFLKITSHEGYLAAPGTILNSAYLYILIRHFGLKNLFEAGTATGFYSSFLLLAAIKNGGHLTTCDLIGTPDVGSMILNSDSPHLSVLKQTDSLEYLKTQNKKKNFFDLYVHDSQHTFSHMLKELYQFKKCEKDSFFCFFDDQRSEDFWSRCVKMRFFDKQNYDIGFTNEEEQLGGFLHYVKK